MKIWKLLLISILFLSYLSGSDIIYSQPENPENEKIVNNDDSYDDDFDQMLGEKTVSFELKGYYKNLFIFQRVHNYYGDNYILSREKNLITDLNRIRLNPVLKISDILILHVDIDNEAIFSTYNKSFEFDAYWRPSHYNELTHPEWDIVHNRDIYYRMKIHRAYAKLSLGDFTFTLGRQQIRFGSAKLWNPLDIMNPISPTFVEGPQDQGGIDAIRVDYYFNETTELSLVYNQKRYENKPEKIHIRNSNSVARFKTAVIEDIEIAVLGGYISRRGVIGADLSITVLDGILRSAFLYSNPENGASYIQCSGGYEYTFSNGIYFLVEYFYNQNALNYNSDLKSIYYSSAIYGIHQWNYFYLSNQFVTFNQHYSAIALGYEFHSLLRGDFFTIYDFQGKALFFNISLKYNILEDVDLTAGVMLGHIFGNKGSSDFSAIYGQNMYYMSLQWFF